MAAGGVVASQPAEAAILPDGAIAKEGQSGAGEGASKADSRIADENEDDGDAVYPGAGGGGRLFRGMRRWRDGGFRAKMGREFRVPEILLIFVGLVEHF